MSDIEEIKARLDIVELVSETVQLKRAGKNYTGFCPFHANTRTPAFVVWPETQTWRCFGQCSEGGDIYKFVMKREGWDFPEALRSLADRAGVQLQQLTSQQEVQLEEYDRLRALLEEAVSFYRHQLFHTAAGKPALDYLHNRGLTDETIEFFELGYSPLGWDLTMKHFLEKGYNQEDLEASGLITVKAEEGKAFDRFRGRLMFAIRDGRGRMSGFGARALDPDDVPKYLNSPQTAIFEKGSLLYGLDKTRKSIRGKDQVVIVEGYMDVIGPYQAGYTNLVSPMGTALTEHQLRALKRLTRRMVLALDADAAGARATMRGLHVARQSLDRETEMHFNPRGLLLSEGRLNADIRVTSLPPEMDPDEIVLRDPAEWEALIENAKPIVIHVMETLAADKDLSDPKVKPEIAAQVMPLIQDIASPIERDAYIQQLARLLKVDERSLLAEGPPARRSTRRSYRRSQGPQPAPPTEDPLSAAASALQPVRLLEQHCLSIIIRQPELLYRVDRALQSAGLGRIAFQDFQFTNHQEIFKVSLSALEQDEIEPLNYVLEHLPLPLAEHADAILQQSNKLNPDDERVRDDLLHSLLRLREYNLHEAITQLRFLMEDAQQASLPQNSTDSQEEVPQDHSRLDQYQHTILKNSATLLNIQKALANPITQALTG